MRSFILHSLTCISSFHYGISLKLRFTHLIWVVLVWLVYTRTVYHFLEVMSLHQKILLSQISWAVTFLNILYQYAPFPLHSLVDICQPVLLLAGMSIIFSFGLKNALCKQSTEYSNSIELQLLHRFYLIFFGHNRAHFDFGGRILITLHL